MTSTISEAKAALDNIIKKARVHLYKPIQIAEILYRHRNTPDALDLSNLESYRNPSKQWRDEVTVELLGTRSTSSARYQDNLFDDNAIPPAILAVLGEVNAAQGGIVENYIYQ